MYGLYSSCHLGENLALMLTEAGLPFEYIRVKSTEYKELKVRLEEQNIFSTTVPVLEIDGKFFSKTVPTMRYLARKLGKYGGSTDEEWQHLDALADLCNDWREKYCRLDELNFPEDHFEKVTAGYLSIFEKTYGVHEGPYILGEEFTFVDILVYRHLCDDHAKTHLDDKPHLKAFLTAIEKRPNLVERVAFTNDEMEQFFAQAKQ
ncbi:hypothetical protein DM01DRAFT_1333788 [Hesseltinella vesiculosa]|uniref:GST N-terminal domain-containing protein n=1 Tax=Hesseltinella vesiculosa TaxID=101127 RepID=A0A1X2GNR9_9FUNG|nr:hypothetical protein DM01DRAFT_1333788 [Hesseltinella vesiculosa]